MSHQDRVDAIDSDQEGPAWTTRDGRHLPICSMSDEHLINVKRFLERQFERIEIPDPPCFQGEMAQMAAEEEWLRLASAQIDDLYPVYRDIVEELLNRGLLDSGIQPDSNLLRAD